VPLFSIVVLIDAGWEYGMVAASKLIVLVEVSLMLRVCGGLATTANVLEATIVASVCLCSESAAMGLQNLAVHVPVGASEGIVHQPVIGVNQVPLV
jgi:hypothetical protein